MKNIATLCALGLLLLSVIGCKKEVPNQIPVPKYSLRPSSGNTETIFTFNANETIDLDDSLDQLVFRWDFNSDGRWDTDWLTSTEISHRFTNAGVYQIDLQAKDPKGAMALGFEFLEVEAFVIQDIRDQQSYRTVRIGEQLWMAENLKYDFPGGSWCHNDSIENCVKYGRLYNWESAKSVCPPGWRLPTREDWDELFAIVGEDYAEKLRSRKDWVANRNGTDTYGFNMKPSSYRYEAGDYSATKSFTYFWTADHYEGEMSWSILFFYNQLDATFTYLSRANAFPVRCFTD